MQLVEHGYAVDFCGVGGIRGVERGREVGCKFVGDLDDAVAWGGESLPHFVCGVGGGAAVEGVGLEGGAGVVEY